MTAAVGLNWIPFRESNMPSDALVDTVTVVTPMFSFSPEADIDVHKE